MSQHSERNRALLAAGTSADKLPIESYREDACCGIRTQCPIEKVCAAAGDAAARHDYCGNLLPCRRCCHRSCAGVLRVVLPSGAGISRLVRPLRQLTLVYGLRVSAADLHARLSSDRTETHTPLPPPIYSAEVVAYAAAPSRSWSFPDAAADAADS